MAAFRQLRLFVVLVAMMASLIPTMSTSTPTASAAVPAPVLSVQNNDTLVWTQVSSYTSYVIAEKVPGKADRYFTQTGFSYKPTPYPGQTVRYGIRVNVSNSTWAREVSISWPTQPPPSTVPILRVDTNADGSKVIAWDQVGTNTSYALVEKVPGQTDRYWIQGCCTYTPVPFPGLTVRYGARVNVTGSAWANEVAIDWPDGTPPPPPPTSTGKIGVVSPADWPSALQAALSAAAPSYVRLGVDGVSTTSLSNSIRTAQNAGTEPILLLLNWNTSTVASTVKNLANLYGPNSGAAHPVRYIEFGNEDSYSYKSGSSSTSSYQALARTYAAKAKDVSTALAGTGVRLIVQADNALQGSVWVDQMYAAVPDLDERIAGWVIHPYGPNYVTRLNTLVSETTRHGAPANEPIFITEWGLSSDNGRCLSDNYGWNKCMTYAEAGNIITNVVNEVRSKFPQVEVFTVYHGNDHSHPGASTGREEYFGLNIYNANGSFSPKPGYADKVKALSTSLQP